MTFAFAVLLIVIAFCVVDGAIKAKQELKKPAGAVDLRPLGVLARTWPNLLGIVVITLAYVLLIN